MSGTTVTVTLGTAEWRHPDHGAGPARMSWTPSATATDEAGNTAATTTASESGSSDKDF